MAAMYKQRIFLPLMFGILLGAAVMYLGNPPGIDAQRPSASSLLLADVADLKARMATVEEDYVSETGGTFSGNVHFQDNIVVANNAVCGGAVQVGATTVDAAAETAGTLRWNAASSVIEVSNGSQWRPLDPGLGERVEILEDTLDLLAVSEFTPTLIEPANGESVTSPSRVLRWNGQAPFRVEVAPTPAFSNPRTAELSSTLITLQDLWQGQYPPGGQPYYWRVISSVHGNDSASEVRMFFKSF